MKTKDTSWWLIVLPVFAMTACGEKLTGPEAVDLEPVPVFAKGGKTSGDIALNVEFRDGTDDGILSDGDPVYVHGQEFVSAIVRTNGMLYFQTFAGKRKDPVLRGVTVDVEDAVVTVLSQVDLDAFKDALMEAGDAWPEFTSEVTLHTRNTDGGMYTMEVGSTLVDGGKIGFNDYGDGDSWEWRLLFDTRRDVDGDSVDEADNLGLCVTHPDANTWYVGTDGAACGPHGDDVYHVDDVTELWRVTDGVFTHVADFTTPMHLTLTRN